jgi:predicted amidophosphoribosyltransferase
MTCGHCGGPLPGPDEYAIADGKPACPQCFENRYGKRNCCDCGEPLSTEQGYRADVCEKCEEVLGREAIQQQEVNVEGEQRC